MHRYQANSGPAITINGKDYSLLRCHQDSYSKVFFVQVSGSVPLRKEDLPTKEWALLSTKKAKARVDTAYLKPWFRYDIGKDFATLAFIAATKESALALVLRFLSQRAGLSLSVPDLLAKAKEMTEGEMPSWLDVAPNQGSAASMAVLLDLSPWLENEIVPTIFKGEKSNVAQPGPTEETR